MIPNTAEHLGREQTVQVGSRSWTITRWDRSVWWDFLGWARTQIPDPLDAAEKVIAKLLERKADCLHRARAADLDGESARLHALADQFQAQADSVFQGAMDKRANFLSVNSPEVGSLLRSLEGSVKLLHLLIVQHQPKATLDDAYELAAALGQDLEQVIAVAAGKMPPADPKNG